MSVEGHIAALKSKHEELDKQVREAEMSLGTDELALQELKKEKLRLKDELHKFGAT